MSIPKLTHELGKWRLLSNIGQNKKNINEPYHGTLSSYGYVILIIYYLQHRQPPVLPNLQALKRCPKPLRRIYANGYDCTHDNGQQWINFGRKNTSSLAVLLAGFFKFYGTDFDYQRTVVSIRSVKKLTKQDKNWTELSEQRNYFCIEDPFETDFNVARTVSFDGLATIRYYMLWAYSSLCKGASLKEICA